MNDRSSVSSLFKRRVGLVIVLGVTTLVLMGLFTFAIQVVLLTFAGILGGIMLSALTSQLTDRTPLPRWASLALVIVLLLGVTAGTMSLVGPALYEQSLHLSRELPSQARALTTQLESSRFAEEMLSQLPKPKEMLSGGGELAGQVATAFTSLAGVLVAGLFILVTSLFFAARPDKYIDPMVRLVPPVHRDKASHLLEVIGVNLRNWLVARFISMLAVGVLTGVGLWLIDIPAAASLGLLAGVLSFVPNLGPILSALPGVLLGLADSPMTALWAALLYIGVQIIEGNLITPFAEQQAVSIPPAYLLAVQLLMGLLTGVLGLLVATPVCVVVVLTVRELYVDRIENTPSRIEAPGIAAPPDEGSTKGPTEHAA